MREVQRLAGLMARLEEQLMACMRCGFCQAVCPLYAQTGRETDVARGKLVLLKGLADEMLHDPLAVKERLERCLLCGSCAAGCPSGVKVLDIFFQARAILGGYLGLSPAKQLVLRGLLARPALFDGLLAAAPGVQDLIARPVNPTLDTARARLGWPLGHRHFKRLATRPFHRQAAGLKRPGRPGRPRVVLFTGCLIDKLFPRVEEALLMALEHHGVGVSLPAGQACCGLPALAAGDSRTFARLLAHNLERLDPGEMDYLVTACATCAASLARLWPLMAEGLDGRQARRMEALAAKTREASQFLVEAGLMEGEPPPAHPQAAPLTYHDPCHLKKSLGVAAQPRRVLAANPAYRLVEMREPDWCCGMGGSFNLAHYPLSEAIGRRKLVGIRASGAAAVATSCPACMLQIGDALSQAGAATPVLHVMEVYAQGLSPACRAILGPPGTARPE